MHAGSAAFAAGQSRRICKQGHVQCPLIEMFFVIAIESNERTFFLFNLI
jgi:hypothetical protein